MPGAGEDAAIARDDARPGPPPQPTPPGAGMSRERWMALCLRARLDVFPRRPVSGLRDLVGRRRRRRHVLRRLGPLHRRRGAADPARVPRAAFAGAGRAAWWAAVDPVRRHAVLQRDDLPGHAHRAVRPEYDRLVWRPDAFGSICFLVSGAIAYRASPRHGWLPRAAVRAGGSRRSTCSAASSSASRPSPATSFPRPARCSTSPAANWNTALGAACFLACALATLRTGRTLEVAAAAPPAPAGVGRRARRRAAPPPRPRAPMSPGRPAGRRHDAHLVPGAAGAPTGTSS